MQEERTYMLDEYDFSHARKNPYEELLKKQMNTDVPVVDQIGSEEYK